MNNFERTHIRQTGLIDPAKLTQKIAIIGAGSIGSWTALCLGKLGCQDITVIDFDTVEVHNAGSQIYTSSDEGMNKTQALEERLQFLLEDRIKTIQTRWTPENLEYSLKGFDIVIAAVDSITPRKEIFEHLLENPTFYIDARMAANAIEIYSTNMQDPDSRKAYEATLFAEEDTLPIACSERSVVYNVFVIAGLIGTIIAKYANDQVIPQELVTDLYNMTMYV